MSRAFVPASNDNLGFAGVVAPTYPYTLAGWFKRESLTTSILWSQNATAAGGGYQAAVLLASGAVRAQADANGSSAKLAESSELAVEDEWNFICCVFDTNSRTVKINGATKVTNTDTSAFTAQPITQTNFGCFGQYNAAGSYTLFTDSTLGQWAVYDGILSDADQAALASGEELESVGTPLAHWIITGTDSPELDSVGSADMIVNGTTAGGDEPPINPAPATAVEATGPTSGYVGIASTDFSISLDGAVDSPVSVSYSSASGTFSPASPQSVDTGETKLFTYTPASAGAHAIAFDNDGGLSDPADITFSASATSVPGKPTGANATAGSGSAAVAFTAPAVTGGYAIDLYRVTASTGQTQTGATSPITIAVANGIAVTFTVAAHNTLGYGLESDASNSVTPEEFVPYVGCATFPGDGSKYLDRELLPALTDYPFAVAADVRVARDMAYTDVYCLWAAERSTGVQVGTIGLIQNNVAQAFAADGTSFSIGSSPEAVLMNPYFDRIVWVHHSATHASTYYNGVLQYDDTWTSRALDFSAGSPRWRIGRRGISTAQGTKGEIANVVVYDGDPDSDKIALLSQFGFNYAAINGVAHWYPCTPDFPVEDVVGGLDMGDVGTVAYLDDTPAIIPPPTRAQAIHFIHKQDTLPSNLPTIQTGATSPISTSGWSNLASVERFTMSFTGNCGAYTAPYGWHYIPTSNNGHLVLLDPGHDGVVAEWGTIRFDEIIKQTVAAGYPVFAVQMPLEGAPDAGYVANTPQLHGSYASLFSDSASPFERWTGPLAIGLNNLAGRYQTISAAGLSGGGQRMVYYAALDLRINHSIISLRGIMADRRYIGDRSADPEQLIWWRNWKTEEYFRLCAKGTNRRLWLGHHPTDGCCFRAVADSDGFPSGSYLDATSYDTSFLAPIRAVAPYADVQFKIIGGAPDHIFNQEALDGVYFPALAAGLTTGVPLAPTIGAAVLVGTNSASVSFTAPEDDGGLDITGYTVTSVSGGLHATGSASPIVITGLLPGVDYAFTVHANNADGAGDESEPSNSVGFPGAASDNLVNNYSLRHWKKWKRKREEEAVLEDLSAVADTAIVQAAQASKAVAVAKDEPERGKAVLRALEARMAYEEAYKAAYADAYTAELVAAQWMDDMKRDRRRRKAALLLLN